MLPVLLLAGTVQAKGDKEKEEAAEGIKFSENPGWAATLKKAQKANKLIFVDVYTTWCGPCKLLRKKTFPDKAVGDFFNANFVNVAFDAEAGDGVELAEKFKVPGYPTLLILDKNGNEIARQVGYVPPQELLDFGKKNAKPKK